MRLIVDVYVHFLQNITTGHSEHLGCFIFRNILVPKDYANDARVYIYINPNPKSAYEEQFFLIEETGGSH